MKKLLSLLIVLTISGTAVPTTIAASPYQKEETIKNIDINQQTNNLESLNRNKKQNNNITPYVKVSYEIDDYFSDLYNVITFLQNNDNVRLISPQETGGPSSPGVFYVNENSNNEYFIMPINIENDRRISLIFRSNDFYLQGFIGHPTSNNQTLNVYYYFNDSTITNVSGTTRSERIPFGSNYTGSNGLRADERAPIRWTGIVDAFHQLANYGENPSFIDNDTLRASFVRVILATAESMRFREVRNNIISNRDNDNSTSHWGWYFNTYLKHWDCISKEALNYLIQIGTLVGFYKLQNINIFSKILSNHFKTCKEKNARDLNNNKYCFSIPERVFHYDETYKKNKIISHESQIDDYANYYIHTFNLGKINPVENFTKIEFIGDVHSDCWGTRTEWSSWIYNNESASNCDTRKIKGRSIKTYLEENNNNLSYAITAGKITSNNSWNEIKNSAKVYLQDFTDEDGLANIEVSQRFGLTYYFDEEDKNYYLQVICYQYLEWWASAANLIGKIKIGNGIRLYN